MKARRDSYLSRVSACTNITAKRLLQLMESKQTNLALAADVTTAKELIELADELGPDLCMLKTHIDIIDDFTPALTEQLRALANKHQFLIFEDRKFADIGNTVKHQYANGIFRISDWADVINAHVLPGPGIIEGLASAVDDRDRGLILLAEMSSRGHLMDAAYIEQTRLMAEQYPDFVIGFITQHAISHDPRWINFTPGVKLASGTDPLGQQYVTPARAIIENGTDVIIVGRGITHAKEPAIEAKLYRIAGWDAYREACV